MRHSGLAAAITLLALVVSASGVFAQNPQTLPPRLVARGQAPPPPGQEPPNAYATRNELGNLLNGLPPSVREVLRADPSLIDRPDYLAPYPVLQEFLDGHPEVARNPTFFLGSPNFGRGTSDAIDVFAGVLAGTAVFIVVMSLLVTFGVVARQVVLYRRWVRQTKMQADVHTKILDRLQSNEDLLAYIQTPAGKNFLEFAPVQADEPRLSVAPLNRILWFVQLGVLLAALGLGLRFAQGSVPEEIVPGFTVLSVIVSALGLGAIVSAAVAYVLSARLGMVPTRRQEG